MRYEALIREAMSTLDGTVTLARLLDRVDALAKSVPTLAELNEAFAQLNLSGDLTSFDWRPVTPEAYAEAVAHNHEAMVRFLESRGFTREQQEETLRRYAAVWPKREA